MLPHQLRKLVETLNTQLGAIKEVIQEQATANRNATKKADEKWSEVPGVIAANILGMADDKKAAATQRDEAYAQQERLIASQAELSKWTKGAFIAASLYAAIALWQGLMTRQIIKDNATGLEQTLCRMQEQINQTKRLADNAGDSLIVSERAYLVTSGANIDSSLKAVMLSVLNIGHLPSSNGTVTLFEMTFRKGVETKHTIGLPIGNTVEGHWSQWNFPDISYVTPPALWTRVPEYSQDDFSQQKIGVVISGNFSYRDGFDNTPMRTNAFCYVIFYDPQRHSNNSIPCDEKKTTDRIKRAIDFPKNRIASP